MPCNRSYVLLQLDPYSPSKKYNTVYTTYRTFKEGKFCSKIGTFNSCEIYFTAQIIFAFSFQTGFI